MGSEQIDKLCRVRELANVDSARLVVNEKELSLEVVSFSNSVHLNEKKRIIVDVDAGRVATLLDNVRSGGGSSYSYGSRVERDRVTPNIVLVGPDEWPSDAMVRWAHFSFRKGDIALRNRDAFSEKSDVTDSPDGDGVHIIETTVFDSSKLKLFNVETDDLALRLSLLPTEQVDGLKRTVDMQPYVEVEFKTGASVHEYLVIVQTIVACFALSIGSASHPTNLRIHHLSKAEQNALLDKKDFRGAFDTYYRWTDVGEPGGRSWVGNAVLQAINNEEKEAAAVFLEAWLERREPWRAAYSRMREALMTQDSINRERLLNAFAWFEAMPFNEPSKDFTAEQVVDLAALATNAVQEMGLDEKAQQRVGGLLKKLKEESLSLRLKRLIGSLREKFGEKLVPSSLEKDCLAAIPLRGAAAHAEINWDKVKLEDFLRYVYGLEAVCFLLTITGLPLPVKTTERIGGHPLMSYLHVCKDADT